MRPWLKMCLTAHSPFSHFRYLTPSPPENLRLVDLEPTCARLNDSPFTNHGTSPDANNHTSPILQPGQRYKSIRTRFQTTRQINTHKQTASLTLTTNSHSAPRHRPHVASQQVAPHLPPIYTLIIPSRSSSRWHLLSRSTMDHSKQSISVQIWKEETILRSKHIQLHIPVQRQRMGSPDSQRRKPTD